MEVFNRTSALDRLDWDVERLEDLLEDFQIKIPGMMKAFEKAAQKKRAARLEELASELRLASDGIGAEGMVGLAEQMLEAARGKDYDRVGTLLTNMGMELDWLMRILDENRCSGNL